MFEKQVMYLAMIVNISEMHGDMLYSLFLNTDQYVFLRNMPVSVIYI